MHYWMQELHRLPHEFFDLPQKEKAFIIASMNVRAKKEKEEADKIRRQAKK